MRKTLIAAAVAAATIAGVARAEVIADAIPAEFLGAYGLIAVQVIQAQFPNPPVKVEPAPDRAVGFHVQQKAGVVAMPDKNFTLKSIEEATDKDVPVGVIATQALSLMEKDGVIKADRLAVADLMGQAKLPLFFLAVKAKGEDRVLEVYSKDGKSLLTAPLKKLKSEGDVALGVKLINIDLEGKKMDATVSLANAYEATLHLGMLDP